MKVKLEVEVTEEIKHSVNPSAAVYVQKTIIETPAKKCLVEVDVPDDVINTFRNLFGASTMIIHVVGTRQVNAGESFESTPTSSEKPQQIHGSEFYSEIGHKGGQEVRKLIQAGKEHEEA